MKKIFLSIIASASIFAATSCSDMLDVESTRQVENPALDQKTDSVFYLYWKVVISLWGYFAELFQTILLL